jgi:transposase-like protein
MCRRKLSQHRSPLPSDEAAVKRLDRVLATITQSWTLPPRAWQSAMNHFAILVGES